MNNQDVTCDGATNKLAPRPQARRIPRQKHGLSRLLKARHLKLDGRSAAMQAMSGYRANLLASLGGRDLLSEQELIVVELIVKDQFILSQVDGYLGQVGYFNRRKKSAHPLTVQRMTIADGPKRSLLALGLKRRSKPVKSLAELLAMPSKPTQPASTVAPGSTNDA